MRILLTGGTGFIGAKLLHDLKARGAEVVTIGRTAGEARTHIFCDILKKEDIEVLEINPGEFDVLVHLAWYAEPGLFWESELNVQWEIASIQLIQKFKESGGQHVVVAGSVAEYDSAYGFFVEDLTPISNHSKYSQSKNGLRQWLNNYADRHQIKVSWMRIFYPFGDGMPKGKLFEDLRRLAMYGGGGSSRIKICGNCVRDFIHRDDIVSAFSHVIFNKCLGVYNISTMHPVRLIDFAVWIFKKYGGKDFCVDSYDILDVPVREIFSVGSNLKLVQTGWRPRKFVNLGDFLNE